MAWHLRVGRLVFKTETKKDPQVNVKESSKTEDGDANLHLFKMSYVVS